jgi:hypothetical protein
MGYSKAIGAFMHHLASSAYMAQRPKPCARCRKVMAERGNKYCKPCQKEKEKEAAQKY